MPSHRFCSDCLRTVVPFHSFGIPKEPEAQRGEFSGFETTSSASGHTVATGPPSLDTGQAGRIAKSLMSDPAFGQLRDHFEGHSRSLIADFDWVRQVGVPLSQVIVWRGPSVDHSPHVGARVGEASHPGPSGGGSRATSRRRAELNMDVDDGVEDSLGLASMLRPLIEKLLKEVLRDLLGSSGLKKLLAGMLAGGQLADASLRPPSAAPPADDEVSAEGKGNKERWRKRRGGGNAENDGQPKGQGKTGDVAPAKGKGKIGSAELSKGKGKNGGAELSQGNGQSGSGLHPKGKGKTDEPAADDGGGDWTVVGRRAPKASPPAWRLRDALVRPGCWL